MAPSEPSGPGTVLETFTYTDRLAAEIARIRRSGGFLSLMLVDLKKGEGNADAAGDETRLTRIARRLRTSVRLQDSVALLPASIALLLPDTSAVEAGRAAERLLRVAREDLGADDGAAAISAGTATVFGEVEGGADALTAAAEEALQEASAGQIVRSRVLEGRPRILVVDDNLKVAQVLAEAISERGWEGHPCTDVKDAHQRVVDGGYDALFVDLVLPESSGIKLLRHAIAYHPRRPAVLMSGSDAQHDAIMEALEMGPVVFIRKPISMADLDSALQMFREMLPGAQRMRRA